MIGYIKGKIIGQNDDYALVENSGIGYMVFSNPKVLEKAIGSEVELHTYMQVREDAINLYGFETAAELLFFQQLITVSGVGPKSALAVLSAGDMDLVKNAIINQDAAVFTKVGGVGKKTAERIIVELKEKLGAGAISGVGGKSDDLLSALEALGYSNREIKEVLPKIDHSLASEEKLRQAIKMLGRQ
ncbi:Holliday junction branch migration protein RuvA [Patescibacteria group bacterium]|nr:Holliday junction branch migration protein RuvA [Patescibacteria group bacterium]